MADQELGNLLGFAAVDVGGSGNRSDINGGGDESQQFGFFSNDMSNIGALRGRLTTIDSGFYTTARLNSMTKNDMVFAVRTNDYASTIRQ
jgi:hypothetical protein